MDILDGLIARYECPWGYKLHGSPEQVCKFDVNDGEWQGKPPQCQQCKKYIYKFNHILF